MAYYQKADGTLIHSSAASSRSYYASYQDQTIAGTSAAETFWGDGSYRSLMAGGAGDDTYYVKTPGNKVVEGVGGGIDTINTWMNYTLPDNVENLVVSGNKLYAYGNALDNIVSGGAGSQTINGMAGNDVLIGGAGSDTFVVMRGNGSDVILDFQTGAGGDTLWLHDYGIKDFASFRSVLKQVGSDVSADLGNGEVLIFRNQAIDAFMDVNFKSSIQPSSLNNVFSDDFDSLSLFNGTSGTWKSTYYYGDRTLPGNGERQFYVDPGFKNLGIDPYSLSDGSLVITARKASAELKPQINTLDYTSGMISSEQSFSMQYGYFEMRAELPGGKGLWPAFWLLPVNGEWPPELDVMEVLGHDTNLLYTTAHSKQSGSHTSSSAGIAVPDVSDGFHTYGVDWQKDKIVWYFDGVEVYSAATPADMHQPMYMIANLAVGGGWPGNPDATTVFPAQMKIDYIRAYQRPSDHAAVGVPSSWAPIDPTAAFRTLDASGAKVSWNWSTTMAAGDTELQLSGDWARYAIGNEKDNYIAGSNAQYNELDGGKGNDTLKGGGGIDVFILKNSNGNDVILDFSNTPGNTDKLRLDGFHFTHFDDVKPWLTQVGNDTMLRLDQDQAVLLKNVVAGQLRPEQFVFVNSVAAPTDTDPIAKEMPFRKLLPTGDAGSGSQREGVVQLADGRLVFDDVDPAATVLRLYHATFDRAPDGQGFNYWTDRLSSGTLPQVLAEAFASSAEFGARYGSLSNEGFVRQLYRNVLDREGDGSGIRFWVGKLDGGELSRGDVLLGFSESPEHRGIMHSVVAAGLFDVDESAAQVARLYRVALDRLPDQTGLRYWIDSIKDGVHELSDIADYFVASPELSTKYGSLSDGDFIERLYENALDRGSDPDGRAFWTHALENGAMDRGDILISFAESFENRTNTSHLIDDGIVFA